MIVSRAWYIVCVWFLVAIRSFYGHSSILSSRVHTLEKPQTFQQGCAAQAVYKNQSHGWKSLRHSARCKGHHIDNTDGHEKDLDLKVMYTADLHGHAESLPRIAQLVAEQRRLHPSLLLLDLGDISIGTLFSQRYGASAMSEAMERLGYTTMSLGNHDLEYAQELPTKFPILSANVPGYVPSKMIKVDGVNIGLLAYTMTEAVEHSSSELIVQLTNTALCLRKAGASLVVLMGHGLSSLNLELSTKLQGLVDVILGGHTHELLGCTNGYVSGDVVLHPGAAGEYVGILHVRRLNKKTSFHSHMVKITNDLPQEPGLSQWLAPKLAALPQPGAALAHITTAAPDQPRACRRGACVTGSIVAAAVRWHYNCSVVALFEAGSIRDTFSGPVGEIELIQTLPWENKMVLYHVSGRSLQQLLERSKAAVSKGGGAFLQVAGLRDVDTAPEYHISAAPQKPEPPVAHLLHLSPAKAAGTESATTSLCPSAAEQIESERVYTIAVTDWLAGGGDGYGPLLAAGTRLPDAQQSPMYVREMVARYLQTAASAHPAERKTASLRGAGAGAEEFMLEPIPVQPQTAGSAPPSSMHSVVAILAEIPALIVAHPLRTISTRQQSKVEPGTSGLWNGAVLSIAAVLCSKMIFWVGYYFALAELTAVGAVASALHQGARSFAASMLAGFVEATIMHPVWVIVTRQQVYGVGGAKGVDGEAKTYAMYDNLCDGLGFSLLLVLFPAIRQFLFEYVLFLVDVVLVLHSSSFVQGAIGMGVTIAATILTYPLQTMRTQVQTSSFDCSTLKPFAGLSAKLLAASVNAFVFFFCKRILEVLLID